uniref:Uncharacterized protein n=1 Tax=Leptospira ellisii TaxID=2023197 RepID=A0A2N0BB99_9LEPT|nr:hypothetical protein CH379_05850 [Leptospira ellisii]
MRNFVTFFLKKRENRKLFRNGTAFRFSKSRSAIDSHPEFERKTASSSLKRLFVLGNRLRFPLDRFPSVNKIVRKRKTDRLCSERIEARLRIK